MKTIPILLATTGIAFTSFSMPVIAGGEGILDEQQKSGIYFSAGVGTTSINDLEGKLSSTITNTTEVDNGLKYSAGIGYDFGKFRAELNYRKDALDPSKFSTTVSGTKTAYSVKGDVNATTIATNIFYDFENDSKFTPYVGAGVGATKVELDPFVIDGDDADVDDMQTSYNINLGISYEMSQSSDVFIQADYLTVSDMKLGDSEMDDIKTYAVSAGIRYSL